MAISIPDTLNTGNSEKYILSIRLWSGGLSFSVYNPSEKGSFFYREHVFERKDAFLENFKNFFFENEVFGFPFKRTNIVCVSSPYTLVPEAFFEGKPAARFMDFNFSAPATRTLVNTLKHVEAKVLFGLDEELYEFCCRSLLEPHFIHSLSPLLSYWKKISSASLLKQMYIHVHAGQLDMVCLKQGKLLFVNTFRYEHMNDILYYILYVWKELDMEQLADQLRVFACPDIRIKLMSVLRKYIRYVAIAEAPSEVYLWGSEVVQAPLDILTLSICE